MHDPDVIPPSVAGSLAEIERSVQRFRSCYSLGTDPERSLTDEIITMRFELIRLWSEISSEKKARSGAVRGPFSGEKLPESGKDSAAFRTLPARSSG